MFQGGWGYFFRFARICSPTDRRCAQMPFGVMGTIPQVAPSVRQIADFWHAECVSMRAVCTGIAFACTGLCATWTFCPLVVLQTEKCYNVTCYNKHLPYVRTFFRKPEFWGCKKYIVYIIYIYYIYYIFFTPPKFRLPKEGADIRKVLIVTCNIVTFFRLQDNQGAECPGSA